MSNTSVNQIAKDLLELSKKLESMRSSSRKSSVISGPTKQGQTKQSSTSISAIAHERTSPTSACINGHQYLSEIEQAILRSNNPIEINEAEEMNINGLVGVWINKKEVYNWKGDLPIDQYPIQQDENPNIITKKTQQTLEYVQELAIRYLRPPTPPAPGEIVINQEPNKLTPPAPPIIIRQQPPRPNTPEPLIVREAPPQPPAQVGRKVITISGKRLPPPPRKVVVERLAPLPSKPQSVIIERWLPYSEVKRRVIFNKNTVPDPIVVKPRNVIVQWEAPEVIINKDYKYLGVVRANPVDYVEKYGKNLIKSSNLPNFVTEICHPDGIVLASEHKLNHLHELEGDLEALKLIDLEKEGLSEYKSYLQLDENRKHSSSSTHGTVIVSSSASSTAMNFLKSASALASASQEASIQLNNLVEALFTQIDKSNSGKIGLQDAEKLFLKLNSRLGRAYGEDDVASFFSALDFNNDGSLSLDEFKHAFLNIAL